MLNFNNLSVAKKLGLGFGLVLVLLLTTGLVGYQGLQTASNNFGQYRDRFERTDLAATLVDRIAVLNLTVEQYAGARSQNGRETALADREAAREAATEVVNEAQATIQNQERLNMLAEVEAELDRFADGVDALIDNRQARATVGDEQILANGIAMEDAANEIISDADADEQVTDGYLGSQILSSLMLARVYEASYQSSRTQADLDRVNAELSALEQGIADLEAELQADPDPQRQALLADLRESKQGYEAGLAEYVDLIAQRNEIQRGVLTEAPQNARDVLVTIQDHYAGEMAELGPQVEESNARAIQFIVALGLGAVLFGLFMAYYTTRSMKRQLGGEPADVQQLMQQVAEGDFTVSVKLREGDESSMLHAIKGMLDRLSQTIGEVRASADSLASASEEVSATSQSLSQASSEQASSVEESSSSMEEMTANINQNTENSKVTDDIASKAAKQAEEGGEAVNETVAAMKNIAEKISIIDDIAYQTNLLALNAAIEAARAGQHGKGFAVVAAEVRKLAERSQVAAQEITEVASSSVDKADKAGELLNTIVPDIKKAADLVQEITAGSEEQSSGVNQINEAMEQLNQLTQQNASSSEELSATAEEMSAQAEQLQGLMRFFKVSEEVASRTGGAPRTQGNGHAGEQKAPQATQKSEPRGEEKAKTPNEAEFERF